MHEYSSHRSPEADLALIRAKTTVAITLAAGGILSVLAGLAIALWADNSRILFELGSMEVTARGVGVMVMASSAIWSWFAYKARPRFTTDRRQRDRSQDGPIDPSMTSTQVFDYADIRRALAEYDNTERGA